MRGLAVIGYIAITSAAYAGNPQALPGWQKYEQLCAACHGIDGNGGGAAVPFLHGVPPDFTRAQFAWRSTPSAATDQDLRRTIHLGVRGTSMPAFTALGNDDVDELVHVVREFAPSPIRERSGAPSTEPAGHDPQRGAQLWTTRGCAACHGPDGRGNRALPDPPYDLTAEPLHRPRAGDEPRDRREAAVATIANGARSMPSYADLPPGDLWALADYVVEVAAHATPVSPLPMDTANPLAIATWPGSDGLEARVFGQPIAPQGPPLPGMTPAEASLSAAQCGRCHAKQVREWQPSLHAGAMSVGYQARLADGADAVRCGRCHAPLAEQASDPELRAQGVQCAGCHVRGWTRLGPPNLAPSLQTVQGYPFEPSSIYERSDFCMACHQLPPSTAVAGTPLLNTYKEWIDGPYARRGVQCQSCHMPNREHQWLGVHDPTTFRQGIKLTAQARVTGGTYEIDGELTNIGAGHFLPTTATPAVWLRLELVDGTRVVGSFAQRIGRDVYWDGAWHDRGDTRIPPGQSLRVARTWHGGHATAARVIVEVHPDAYYEQLYARRLGANLLYAAALRKALGSRYIAETREIALP